MTISKYKAFLKVIECGSITKASKQLKYSQPGISHMIDSLEADLGFPILKRSNGSFVPTEDGMKILHYCEQIVQNEDNLKRTASSIHGLMTGSISIGSYNSMLLDFIPDVVSNFTKIYPNIDITVLERDCDEIKTGLTNCSLDIAFMGKSIVPKGFSFIPLFTDTVGLIVHKSHPFAQYDKIPFSLLNGCSFITHTTGAGDVLESVLETGSFTPSTAISTNSDFVSIKLVENQVGVSILSSIHKRLLPDDVLFKEFESPCRRSLGIALNSREYASPAVEQFINHATELAKSFQSSI